MKTAIDQDTLSALVETGAMRDFRAVRKGDAWSLEGRIGSTWLPVRSRREPVRLWASLTAIGRFCENQGIRSLVVEL
ncbi:hypothetical protein EQ826_24085 [Ectopseudomonas mendocina]|nr:hypothetical protein [Pseudomonas mendocina]TRO19645.1 hypothetical protein EQ826_24085 [Pseudomonas mendocina]